MIPQNYVHTLTGHEEKKSKVTSWARPSFFADGIGTNKIK
jgi:hypothetical protein